MNEVKISYSGVASNCNEMHNIANSMKTNLDAVKGKYQTLSSGADWTGDAASACMEKFKKLVDTFDEAYNEIEYSILYMAKCSDGYQAIDQNVMKEICNNLNISEPNLSNSKIFPSTM